MIEIMIILSQKSNIDIEFRNIAEDSSASFRKEPNPLFLIRIRIFVQEMIIKPYLSYGNAAFIISLFFQPLKSLIV